MHIRDIELPGLFLIMPKRIEDARGWFSEVWNKRVLEEQGYPLPDFVQENHSYSKQVHVLRGLHYQAPPHAQDKLVRCTRGRILDVAVDVRVDSPRYGDWCAADLSAENGRQLFVPKGFLHGFLTLEPDCEVQYKCSDYYAPEQEGSVLWDSLGIEWGIADPIVSQKDAAATRFADFKSPFTHDEAPS